MAITLTVKAVDGDYPDLLDALAAVPNPLTEQVTILVDAMAFAYSGGLPITHLTSVANRLIIKAAPGQGHTGIAGTGPRVTSTTSNALTITSHHVTVEGFEFFFNGSTQNTLAIPSTHTYSADSDIQLLGNIFRGNKTGTSYVCLTNGVNLNLTFDNNIVYGSSRLHDARVTGTGTVKSRHNIYWGHASQLLVLYDTKTLESKDNYSGCAVPGAECFWSASAPVGSHNVSSDATATIDYPTGSQINISGASVFTSVTAGSEDFRPLSGTTALKDAGITVTGVSTDCLGVSRPQGTNPDVGAFEFVSATPHNIVGVDSQQVNVASTGAIISTTDHLVSGSSSQQANVASDGAIYQLIPHMIVGADSQGVNQASPGAIQQTLTGATVTIPEFRDWGTGNLLPGEVNVQVDLRNPATGNLIVRKTGQTSHATTAVCTVFDENLVSGAIYETVVRLENGALGIWDLEAV